MFSYIFQQVSNPAKDLIYRVPNPLRIQAPYFPPEFNARFVKINEGRGESKAIYWCQFTSDFFLNVETDEKDLISKFVFELVHDGLYSCTCNSVRRLEFQ